MPKVEGAPKGLNALLEEVYSECIASGKEKGVCSASAWSAAKGAGWYKGKDEKWHKKIKLKKEWIKFLLAHPETGMGYQKVDVLLKDGRKLEKVIVHNAEMLELPIGSENVEADDIKTISF